MQVFRTYDPRADDNTEYPSKHNHARHRWQRVFFSDPGPLNSEPAAKPGSAGSAQGYQYGGMRPNKIKLKSLTPNHNNQSGRRENRSLRHPNVHSKSSHQFGQTPYVGTLRFKGASVKYLRYDEDQWNRPGYWPNCHQRAERWDNYRLNQWEDNRFETCSPTARKRASDKINRSNRSPFQNTPYSEQSPTMLFYQQRLNFSKTLPISRSMPQLRPATTGRSQGERIFDFTRTQRQLTKSKVQDESEEAEDGNEEDLVDEEEAGGEVNEDEAYAQEEAVPVAVAQ
jgi:hypothetical protein